jgi:hypothetical protein
MYETECLNVWVELSVCNYILVYACMYKIKEWNVLFLFFNSTLVKGKDCCLLLISWPKSLVLTDW